MARPLVYVVEVPTPYRNAEMDRAAAALGTENIHTIFIRPAADGCFDYVLPAICPYHVVGDLNLPNQVSLADLPALLERLEPGMVIVGGYHRAAAHAALSWCVRRSVPYSLRSDSNYWSDRQKGWLRFAVRRVRLGRWVARATRLLVTGTYNRQFWQRYGMQGNQEGWWPQWIDYEHYAQARGMRVTQRAALRQRFNLGGGLALLHVGRLVARKRVDLLCEAIATGDAGASLVVAGSGPEQAELARRYGPRLGDRLRMLGAVDPAQLPELYAAADVLAVASGPSEPWGMVVNEAAAAGLPIICQRQVGAAGDLVIDGVNGMLLDRDDVDQWRSAIGRLAADSAKREQMGVESATIADQWRDRSDPAVCLGRLHDEFGGPR